MWLAYSMPSWLKPMPGSPALLNDVLSVPPVARLVVAVAPPTFVFFASDASAVHFSYRRYLENRLREQFGFDGTPIRLVFRDRTSVKLPRRKKLRSAPVGSAKGPRRHATSGRARKPS